MNDDDLKQTVDLVGKEKRRDIIDEDMVELRGPGVGWFVHIALMWPRITI